MKLKLLFWLMCLAWTIDEYADDFVEWAQQQYSNELYGIGTIR